MSLSRLALRIITTQALSGATLAGTRVFDSAIDKIDFQIGTGQREPFLVVYTDDHTRTPETGRDLRHGGDSLEIVIEAAVAAPVSVPVSTGGGIPANGGQDDVVEVPNTDAGLEIIIDLIGAQITDALMGQKTVWSGLWNDFVLNVSAIVSRRGASAESGARLAARQIVMTCDVVADPVPGGDVSALWLRFLDALDGTPDVDHLGPIIRHALQSDNPLKGWRTVGSVLGLGEGAVSGIGLDSVTDAQGDPVGLVEAVLDLDGPDITVTETLPENVGG